MSIYSFTEEDIRNIFGNKDLNQIYFNIIIDGMNMYITNFYKMYGILNNSENEDTGGLYTTLRNLLNIIQEFEPYINKTLFNIVYETGKSQNHLNIDEEYKGNRDIQKQLEEKYDTIEEIQKERFNFRNQIEALKQITMNIPVLNHIQISKTEGDFAIRFLITELETILSQYNIDKSNIVHIIFSNDSDFLQLLEFSNIIIYNFRLKRYIYSKNINTHFSRYSKPMDVLLSKIICGDATDNIKGIKGIGAKRFAKINEIISDLLVPTFEISELFNILEMLKTRKEIAKITNYPTYSDILKQNYKLVNLINYENVVSMITLPTLEYLKNNIISYIDSRINTDKKSNSLLPIVMILGRFDILSMLDPNKLNLFSTNYELYLDPIPSNLSRKANPLPISESTTQ